MDDSTEPKPETTIQLRRRTTDEKVDYLIAEFALLKVKVDRVENELRNIFKSDMSEWT